MVCLGDLEDRMAALEPGWGGPGEIKALMDDGGDPGPGEEEQEKRTDEWIRKRLIMMEETLVRRGRDGQDKGGRGGWGW